MSLTTHHDHILRWMGVLLTVLFASKLCYEGYSQIPVFAQQGSYIVSVAAHAWGWLGGLLCWSHQRNPATDEQINSNNSTIADKLSASLRDPLKAGREIACVVET